MSGIQAGFRSESNTRSVVALSAGSEALLPSICRAFLLAITAAVTLLAPVASASATTLPTTIKENTTLTPAGSPYTGSSTIESGVTVQVKPGTTFKVQGITTKGTLKVEGTAEEPVLFIANTEPLNPWCSLTFQAGSGASVVDHAELRSGGACGNGSINVEGSSPTIKNSVIRNSTSNAIKVSGGGAPEIADNQLLANNSGIYLNATGSQSGEVNIHGNYVEGGATGIEVMLANTTGSFPGKSLGGNSIVKTTGTTALSYNGPDIPNNITGNVLLENKQNMISIGGKVTSASTWNNAGTPILISEGITVQSGAALTITKGVLFKTAGPGITTKGTLKVEGTAAEPVLFVPKTIEPLTTWCSLSFAAGSGASVVDHAELRSGGACGNGSINIEGSSPTIKNSVIRNSTSNAIRVTGGGSPEIADNQLLANNSGIYVSATGSQSGEVNIHGNYVEGGSFGIDVSLANTTGSFPGKSLGGNSIIKVTGNTALSYKGPDIPGNITGNVLIENKQNLISIGGKVASSSTWNNAGTPILISEGITVQSGATLTITKGVLFKSSSPGITTKGTLKVEGTAEEPVLFIANTEPLSPWCGLTFQAGSGASVLDHAELRSGGSCGNGSINIEGSSPTIKNSVIRNSTSNAIKVTASGAPKIEWNRFRSNSSGLSYTGTGKLSAPNNDWGCANGPKPAGCGDAVTSNVEWKPAVQLPEDYAQCRGEESQCGEGADPVSLASGRLNYSHRDLMLTNKGEMPLEFTRSYSSGSGIDTGLGFGWAQTGLASATELASGAVLVLRQDGRQDLFYKIESGYKAPSGVTSSLAKVEGTFQLTTLEGTVYRFDASGRIASITDDHGLQTTYGYNAEGRLAQITDPSAQTLTFTYNASNHITLVKDSTGREVKYAYSAAGDLESATDALGGVTKYAYDAGHQITSITDPRGNVILKNAYDSQGRIVEQRDGLEHLWKLFYGSGETVVTEPEGGKLKYGFDSQSRVISETDQLVHTTSTSYDAAGNVNEVVRPGGANWTFGHDAAGNVTSAKDPEGGERKFEYDSKNRLVHLTDAGGGSWSFEWSAAGDLITATDPEGATTTYTYNASGQPLTQTDPNKHKAEFSYDSRGNRLSATDPLGNKTSFEYNSRNFPTSQTMPGLKAEAFERNALGDLIARTTPEGRKTKYVYDANGLPTQVTDPAEGVWKIERDAMERSTAYIDPLGQETKFSYNGNLRPVKVVDRRGKETSYAYNLANQLTEVKRPEGETWHYGYDGRGNRSSILDPRSNETTYGYDLLDRRTEADEPLSVSTDYSYDSDGNLISVKDPRGNTTSYAYDKLGRLTEITQPLEKKTTFTYDSAGNQLTKTTPHGTLGYSYDAADRLTKVSSGESMLRSYGYDAANRRTSATDAEGHKIEIGYTEEGASQFDQRRPGPVADPQLRLARQPAQTGRRTRDPRIRLRQTQPDDRPH
jgi:YD repeat-containing protein